MKINIRIKNEGDQIFYLQPLVGNSNDKEQEYILIRILSEVQTPPIRLHFKDDKRTFNTETTCEIDEPNDIFKEKINNLALEVIEALKEGKDLSAEDIPECLEVTNPYDPDMIRVEPSTMSLRQVNDMIKDQDINLSPDFQRNAIWDGQRKCRLIESILLRIPLPVFYFSADKNGQLSVVDGLQRLTAIHEFMNNKLILKGLEYLNECEGCTYSGTKKLDERLYRRFNLTQITTNVIDSSSPIKVKFDIFRRLNTGGKPLNSQELRNCLASPQLREALKNMSKGSSFTEATTNSISDDRMDAQECALRYMYFRMMYIQNNHKIESYSGSMDSDLDLCVDKFSHDKNFDFNTYEKEYDIAMKNAKYLFGRHAFRKVYKDTQYDHDRSVINKALFLSISVILSDYEYEYVQKKCVRNSWVDVLGNVISSDDYFLSMLSYGTNGWKNLVYTFNIIGEIAKKILG